MIVVSGLLLYGMIAIHGNGMVAVRLHTKSSPCFLFTPWTSTGDSFSPTLISYSHLSPRDFNIPALARLASILLNAVYSYSSAEPTCNYSVLDGNYLAYGYSPTPMLCVIVLVALMIILALSMGSRRLKGGLPVMGSCSVAISAACHAKIGDEASRGLKV